MPSVTPFELPMFASSKKRRRDDDHSDAQVSLYGLRKPLPAPYSTNSDLGPRTAQYNDSQHLVSAINHERLLYPHSGKGPANSLFNAPRKVIPLPSSSKRLRLVSGDEEHPQEPNPSHAHPEHFSTLSALPHHARTGTNTRAVNPSALLNPCHICHRKPTKKSDLDSFADCMGCGQRACFVCIRACQGWVQPLSDEDENTSTSFIMQDVDDDNNNTHPDLDHKQRNGGGPDGSWNGRGHREMVCSRCCVERGSEGDVVCLGCLAGMEGA
ncbi:uncharacterized protein GGS25DRAFT_472018 [Hypoxylon fragiforme]|uniref:uncharacterized protein n=1 Tax=Hypoxylon fragiforme TaxID=63214 RepID=UPI0020C7374B|nr:uncharacterized protein GGS25DRAFT_472018 [Hypoxylon fragiforme]KAI2614501.1 hypothetical protein GGS25DRAFT_472018 [Hypoxylon fragiforme]